MFWPDPELAWQSVEDRLEAANSGFENKTSFALEVETAIGEAMRAAGTRNGYHKVAFIRTWEQATIDHEQRRRPAPGRRSTSCS